jgi:hypothetical protein
MKRILLVHLPFCTPVSPPYAVANLYSFLKNNCSNQIDVLDLNLEFHLLKFGNDGEYFRSVKWDDYDLISKTYMEKTKGVYAENNKNVRENQEPEFIKEMYSKITELNPDVIAFSLIYSSQIFYAHALIKKLKDKMVVIGGPAVNLKLSEVADKTMNNEFEFLQEFGEFKTGKSMDYSKLKLDYFIDYSKFDLNKYFSPQIVLPLKTSTTCFYKGCTFCDHYAKVPYKEIDLSRIENTVINSHAKYFFLIDDMIPVNRLIKLSEIFQKLGAKFACQLRPTADYNEEKLKILRKNGLDFVIWGVESGNDRVLEKIRKGTNVADIEKVLKNSHKAGIRNVLYIMFGFPTETKEEFMDTINFLQRNDEHITLVSPSIFGLQKGTPIFLNPQMFGITQINEQKRKLLGDKVSYKVNSGLSHEEALQLKKKNKNIIESVNKVPKTINFFREHLFFDDIY